MHTQAHPKYGKYLGQIKNGLAAVDGNAAMDELESSGVLKLDVGETVIELTKEDLLIEMTKTAGFESLSDRGVTVVLDTTLTPELIEEGYVREVVSKVQTMRKDSGFEVTDRIRIGVTGNAKLAALVI